MAETTTLGYKKIFGILLPSWATERMVRLVAGGILSIVVIFFVLILVINPKKEELLQAQSKLKADDSALVELKKSQSGIERIDDDLSAKEIENITAAIPLEYSPELAIFVLRQIANDTGVSIVNYSLPSGILVDQTGQKTPTSSDKMVDFMTYIIKLTVSAPVETILRFVAKVESSLPYGLVSDLNLQEVTKLSKSGAGKNVQIALELKYFQAKINAININKITTLTEKNLENARKLVGYNLFTLPEDSGSVPISSPSGDLFGL